MPESNISVTEFLKEVWDDYNSPITSSFISKIGVCKSTIAQYEESIDSDRRNLNKLKKSLKALRSSGSLHVTNESLLAESLLRLSLPEKDLEESISQAFYKFSVVTKELSTLLTHLMQKLNNGLMFPLDNFLKNDLAGVKGDLKKPFDKSWKDYEIKFNKIEKEKKQAAKEAGMIKTEVTGPEVAEEMEKERRIFQLQTCEYLIKVNEIRTKKGADLLHHLMDFYQAQNNYFQDGLKTIEHYRCYIEELSTELAKLRQKQDVEKRGLIELREALRESVASFNKEPNSSSQSLGYQLHQLQGNKIFGCEKSGWLLKKSEGKMRKVWQKRKCVVRDGFLFISHSDASKDPVKLNLLTCQVKMVADDPGRKCFDLISSSENRTYHFQCDDSQDLEAWTSVLNNAKNSILMKAFQSEPSSPGNRSSCAANNVILQSGLQKFQELSKAILKKVKKLRGNDRCCDCNCPDPEWLSVNLGVLICLECCGVHRELGVHISRTQSIVIDDIVTSQLILAEVMTNQGFNDIMEATLEARDKPQPKSTMEERKHFIRQKYEKRKYAIVTCANNEDRRQDLKQAVLAGDLYALLQVYAEGIDFMQPLPDMANGENALHLAILQENGHNLHIVDFIIQNTNSQELGRQTFEGNTALHLCALEDKSECMKLLLRANTEFVGQTNAQGLTALTIANERNSRICPILLQHAMENKSLFFEHVTTDWAFIQQIMEDQYHDNLEFSDDDLDWSSEIKKSRSRPGSLVLPNDLGMPALSQRSLTTENLNPLPQAAPRSKNASINTFSMISSTSSVSQDQSSISLSNQMFRKKAPPPPPPSSRPKSHLRNPSDPVVMNYPIGSHMKTRLKDVMPTSSDLSLRPSHAKSQNIQIMRPSSDEKGAPPALPPKPSNRLRSQILDLMMDAPPPTTLHSPAQLKSKQESTPDKKNEMFFKKCKALFDCEADNDDELSFKKGEIIIILRMEEDDWWEGQIEGDSKRRGLFPSTFVTEELTTPPLKMEDLDTF